MESATRLSNLNRKLSTHLNATQKEQEHDMVHIQNVKSEKKLLQISLKTNELAFQRKIAHPQYNSSIKNHPKPKGYGLVLNTQELLQQKVMKQPHKNKNYKSKKEKMYDRSPSPLMTQKHHQISSAHNKRTFSNFRVKPLQKSIAPNPEWDSETGPSPHIGKSRLPEVFQNNTKRNATTQHTNRVRKPPVPTQNQLNPTLQSSDMQSPQGKAIPFKPPQQIFVNQMVISTHVYNQQNAVIQNSLQHGITPNLPPAVQNQTQYQFYQPDDRLKAQQNQNLNMKENQTSTKFYVHKRASTSPMRMRRFVASAQPQGVTGSTFQGKDKEDTIQTNQPDSNRNSTNRGINKFKHQKSMIKPENNSNSRPSSVVKPLNSNSRTAPIQKEAAPVIPEKKAHVPLTVMKKPILNDFRIADQPLGAGHFGKVLLAVYDPEKIIPNPNGKPQKLNQNELYALKMVAMHKLNDEMQVQHLFNERNILKHLWKVFKRNSMLGSLGVNPNLVQDDQEPQFFFPRLYTSFASELHANFVFEHIHGLNLFTFQREQLFIDLEFVKYFAACVLQMVDQLHKERIVFRDLKPENIMLDWQTATLRLVDFGFAKLLPKSGRTFTKCGTPGYSAPEVLAQTNREQQVEGMPQGSLDNRLKRQENEIKAIQKAQKAAIIATFTGRGKQEATKGKVNVKVKEDSESDAGNKGDKAGYGFECDIWSWGVLLCELIGGFNPFQGETISETFQNIMSLNVNWPKNMNNSCRKLLNNIFVADPSSRPSIQDIKNHPFFEGVFWEDLETSFRFERIKIQRQLHSILQGINQKQKEDSSRFLIEKAQTKDDGLTAPSHQKREDFKAVNEDVIGTPMRGSYQKSKPYHQFILNNRTKQMSQILAEF